MTIERRVLQHGKTVELTHPVPGFQETLVNANVFVGGEEVDIHVDSDDAITLAYVDVSETQYSTRRTVRESITLSKLDINGHTIQSHPSFFRKRVVSYRWIPSHLYVSPELEVAIKGLIKDGTYTEEAAQKVREQTIFEEQQKIDQGIK